jgi:hypothetical protein
VVLSESEAKIHERINGERQVQELIDLAGLGDFETCRILYDLLARGIIHEIRPDPTKRTEASGPRAKASPALWHALTALVIVGAAASVATMGLNPLNRLPPTHADPILDEVLSAITRSHVNQIDEAIQVYYLQKRFYPDDLAELTRGRLISGKTLRDAWGRALGYVVEDGGYRIVVYGPDGEERKDLSFSRPSHAAARPGPRNAGPVGGQ